jgi:hypothetical protein
MKFTGPEIDIAGDEKISVTYGKPCAQDGKYPDTHTERRLFYKKGKYHIDAFFQSRLKTAFRFDRLPPRLLELNIISENESEIQSIADGVDNQFIGFYKFFQQPFFIGEDHDARRF